jgi:hypothetical protein
MDRAVAERGSLFARMVVQTLLSLVMMGVILFPTAGDWRWKQAWIFLVELGVLSFAVSAWLLRHDPTLLTSRLGHPYSVIRSSGIASSRSSCLSPSLPG